MSLDWSLSAERCFRRCQIQFWFREIAAWHNSKDPLRRESFVLKQLKTLDQWHGLLVHRAIEKLLFSLLVQHARPSWDEVIDATVHLHYDEAHISVQMDLLCFRSFGKPIIVDWKVSQAMGGSDARTQMGVYAWAITRSPKWKVEKMEDVELLEVQLLTPAVFTHRCDEEVAVETGVNP